MNWWVEQRFERARRMSGSALQAGVFGLSTIDPERVAGLQGFEPRYAVLETAVLPLNDRPVERNEGIEPILTSLEDWDPTNGPTPREVNIPWNRLKG